MIVDSHCHVGTAWYEPVESLLYALDTHGVERAVLVQSLGDTDNSYQAECVRRHPGRLASVVRIDETQSDAVEQLRREVSAGAVGLRLQPTTRSPGDDPLALWRAAEGLGLAISCVGAPSDFAAPEFAELLCELSELPVIIEHIGGLRPLAREYDPDVDATIMGLGQRHNAYVKIHGIGEFSSKVPEANGGFPFQRPIPDLITRAVKSFGASKTMWGTDFPLVSGREGYRNSYVWAREELAELTTDDLDEIFGGVASAMFWAGRL